MLRFSRPRWFQIAGVIHRNFKPVMKRHPSPTLASTMAQSFFSSKVFFRTFQKLGARRGPRKSVKKGWFESYHKDIGGNADGG